MADVRALKPNKRVDVWLKLKNGLDSWLQTMKICVAARQEIARGSDVANSNIRKRRTALHAAAEGDRTARLRNAELEPAHGMLGVEVEVTYEASEQ